MYFARHSTDREVALMIMMAYLSYIMAELFNLSGILTVFFCGIVMSHYTWHNVTQSSRTTTKHAFATLSFMAESFIFLYVGMDALDIEKWRFASDAPGKTVALSSILFGLVLVGRASFIFPLSCLSNFCQEAKSDRIDLKQQVTIWWAGLMRGAVSMALAYNQFTSSGHTHQLGNAVTITSTITVVLFSTVVCGLLTKPLIRFLLPSSTNHAGTITSEPSSPRSLSIPFLGPEDERQAKTMRRPSSLRMLLSTPAYTVHYYWKKFDIAVMRPVFGGRGYVPCSGPDSTTEEDSLH